TSGEIAEHVTHVCIGGDDFDLHDWLEDHRACSLRGFLDCHRAGNLERHFAGVDVVVRAVNQLGLHVHHWITRQHAALESFAHTLLGRLDELARDRSAHDFVLEDKAFALFCRLDVDDDVTVLTLTARLANELAFYFLDSFPNRLAISHLRAADVRIDLELPLHPVDDDLEVKLSHSGNDRLTRFLIGVNAESRIFLGELL